MIIYLLIITALAVCGIIITDIISSGEKPLDDIEISKLAVKRLSTKPWDLPLGRLAQCASTPYSEDEITQVAEARWEKSKIESLKPTYTTEEFEKSFKDHVASKRGMFSASPILLNKFCYYAAKFLKNRKYEWVIIAFAKNLEVNRFWINRGIDNKSAIIGLTAEEIGRLAKKFGAQTIAIFHNHPLQSSFNRAVPYNHFKHLHFTMSDADLISASIYNEALNPLGFDFAEYICVAGDVNLVCCSFAKDENGLAEFIKVVKSEIEKLMEDYQQEVNRIMLRNNGIWSIYRLKLELKI